MDKTEDYIASRIEWKAKRYNLPSQFSFFYNTLSSEIQQYLKTHTDKATCGQPILFFTKPTNEWTLICTRQVIFNDNKKVFKVNIQNVAHLKPTLLDSSSKGKMVDMKEIKKSEWHKVTIVDKQNNNYILHANKGNDLFALWNILLMLVRLCD